MKVKTKTSNALFEVYPVGRKDGIRFVRTDNPKIEYCWEELEPAAEVKVDSATVHEVGVKVPLSASGSIRTVQQNKSKPGLKY